MTAAAFAQWLSITKGRFVRPNSKKAPSFIDSKPASENREGRRMTYAITWAEWEETRGHIDETSCSVVSGRGAADNPVPHCERCETARPPEGRSIPSQVMPRSLSAALFGPRPRRQ